MIGSVLITGGAGFIGSHLAEAWLARGARVTVLDDLSAGALANVAGTVCRRARAKGTLRVRLGSAADRALVRSEVGGHDVAYHLAGPVGVRRVLAQPVRVAQEIAETTAVVLDACAASHCPLVFASSSEVYGLDSSVPLGEAAEPLAGIAGGARWAYAIAKRRAEIALLARSALGDLPVFVVRLFNTAGARQSVASGMVLPTFVAHALAGRAIPVHGSGAQRRTFASALDVVEALVRLPASAGAIGRVVNLGGCAELSVLELAERVRTVCGSRSPIRLVPYAEAFGTGFDDVPRRVPDLSRAASLLGWRPARAIEAIIEEVAEHLARAQAPPRRPSTTTKRWRGAFEVPAKG
jgi:UDP-glucose 4-epimerase